MVYNILDFGASPDGKTSSTKAIQKAIDEASLNGGRVIIPAGRFVSGSIELKSNVNLHFENGAYLTASHDLSEYNTLEAYSQNWGCPSEGWDSKHLIYCADSENVSITGFGVIDGAGEYFFGEPKVEFPGYGWRFGMARQKSEFEARPGQLIVFAECQNVTVTDISIKNPTCWAVYFHGCDFVRVSGIKVTAPNFYLNTDGIDVDACRFVTISDCIILTGDDAITFRCSGLQRLKAKRDVCEYVTVTNCILSSASSCFRIGVGTGTIRHIKVSDIIIKSSGIAIHFNSEWINGSTPTYDVSYTNVTATDTGNFLCISSKTTNVSEINISNVYAECESIAVSRSLSEESVRNVTLRNFTVKPIEIDVEEHMEYFNMQNVGNLICDTLKTVSGDTIA